MTEAVDFRPGRSMRPIDWATFSSMARTPWVLYLVSGVAPLPILASTVARREIRQLDLVIGASIGSVAFGLLVFLFVEVWPAPFQRNVEPYLLASLCAAGVLTSISLIGFGPRYGIIAVTYPEPVIFAFVLLRSGWAYGIAALVAAEIAVVFGVQQGWHGLLGQWTTVVAAVIGTSIFAGQLAARMIASTAAEHAARNQLAELNATLQQRVDKQVAELERAGSLKRFLAPQIADAVLSGDSDELFRPHRRRIAVFFCDLRGFTGFAAHAEPEDVIDVLATYYRVVGERLRASNATVGSFAGDGIMAYFNDPVPCDDPAGTAVAMARAIRADLGAEITGWRRLGYDLGFGIGIAVGHATLGVVGFEGRQDYTAIGTVVNLAARLCDAAAPDQILVDARTAGELHAVATTPVSGLALKGFPDELAAYAVG